MKKRHTYVSPTMDLMAKKIFSLPEVTAKFIREVLELPVASAEIVEGSQIHTQEHLEDTVFSTSVDVRARLDNGTQVIIEIQVLKQQYFLNRFHYYLAAQLVENVQQKRKPGHTHEMYDEQEPVYGIAILEKTLLPDEVSPINVYEMRHIHHGGPLLSTYKDGKQQNLLRVAFLELDKYNETESNTVNIAQRQWLEFFGNRPFSQEPDQVIRAADSLLEPSSWSKEEKDMIDEKIRIRENWEMSLATAKADGLEQGREEGLEQGREEGLEQGREEGLTQAREEARLQRERSIRSMVSKGFESSLIAEILNVSEGEVLQVLAQD